MAARCRKISQVDRKINVNTHIFQPADILLPADVDMTRWSVIACDQFTSDPQYWDCVTKTVGSAPSTLHLMLPEYYLGKCDENREVRRIHDTMREYLDHGRFQTLLHSFVYLERTLPDGKIRRGLIGQVDLEAYDYSASSVSPIRATEGTVESRLPPRVAVRRSAALEMPHIMLFYSDPQDAIMHHACGSAERTVYDFDLMLGGGRLLGKQISGANADALAQYISQTNGRERLQYAVGDGNHSLAAARRFWLEKRQTLDESQKASDPARFALVELVNIFDPSIVFEPIHRVMLHTNAEHFVSAARNALEDPNASRTITLLAAGETLRIPAKGASIGALIDAVESFCNDYISKYGGEIDYIHGYRETQELAASQGAAGILLPIFDKRELFTSVEQTGPFPKKSFSIGLGPDKRYYLECRAL